MQQGVFEVIDAAMVRASAGNSICGTLRWPDARISTDLALRGFIQDGWVDGELSSAVRLASPSLTAAIEGIAAGDPLAPARTKRAALALARYIVRMRGRATPFGLFAGVTTARIGGPFEYIWQPDHRLVGRADGQWLSALVAQLEACVPLRQRLTVRANNLIVNRGDRLIVPRLPNASQLARKALIEISLRRTPHAEAALRLARTPIDVAELTGKVEAEFAPGETARVDAMIGELMSCGALVSSLRPPSTAADGLAYVLDCLDAIGAAELPDVGSLVETLRRVHSALRPASAVDLSRCEARMREMATAPVQPVAVDLRLGCQVTLPMRVAAEAAHAAGALARLSPHPRGASGWREYHARFLEHYGAQALVPVGDLIDPVAGLGFPAHYARAPQDARPSAWTGRDERLAALAQQAALDGTMEVVLDDAGIAALAESDAVARLVPHADVTVELRADSTEAADAGAFTVLVTGIGRTALATSGRFLHLLPDAERARLAEIYRALPARTRDAITAQLSFPPHHLRVENVTRVPLILPSVLSLAEYRGDQPDQIRLDDLAVTVDLNRLYLVSLSRRRIVEPVLACAPTWHAVPPLARLLFELPRADCASFGLFDWGGVARLPFLPRLRYGRAILSLAQWRIQASDLPGPAADWREWATALTGLRKRLGLPTWVSVGSGDRQLRLCLDHAMDLELLRVHLDSSAGPTAITESWEPADHAWCGGRAHEFVIPLASTMPPIPAPRVLTRQGALPVIGREHGYPPGSGVLSAKLYGHPEVFDAIVTEFLPDLTEEWNELSLWWFLRYRHPRDHLRLRLHVHDYAQAAARVGRWAADLRKQGLAGDLVLGTYRPEIARFGGGIAMRAAERLFAADSAATAAQLSSTGAGDPYALTAASLADLAGALLGGRQAGLQWLVDHPRPGAPTPLGRSTRLQAIALTAAADPGNEDALPSGVRHAWSTRAEVAAEYTSLLGDWGMEATNVVESLLHLHHNRVHGPGSHEDMVYRLARAAALSHCARPIRAEADAR